MADGILTPCNVARSWHWFRQVTVPCNVACGSGIMTGNLPCGSTRQCGRRLWDDMPRKSPKHLTYCNSTSGFNFDHIIADNTSFCTSLWNFIQIGPPSAEKMTLCRFSRWRISAILDFRGPITGSLKSLCTSSYRSSIVTIALNWLVFEKNSFFAFRRQTDRQTDKQTDGQHRVHEWVCSFLTAHQHKKAI